MPCRAQSGRGSRQSVRSADEENGSPVDSGLPQVNQLSGLSGQARNSYQPPIIPFTAYDGRMSTGTTPSRCSIAAAISGDIFP